jgi:hypothetical protein
VSTVALARRRKTVAVNRRLAALETLTGLGDDILDKKKAEADARMAVIDRQGAEWRDLLNRYPHKDVATLAEIYPMAELKRTLAREFPGA